jgi:hypothetical protein
MVEVYTSLCPLYNYGYPSFRLIDQEKEGDGRYKKIYEKSPHASCQRLLESAEMSEESTVELMRWKNGGDPVVLNSRLNRAVERLLNINREKGKVKQFSGQGVGQAEAV